MRRSAKKEKSEGVLERERRQLRRLETITDVVFALLLWGIVSQLPMPTPADGVTQAEVREIRLRIVAEPATAAVTLPCAALGADVWSLAWLAYPVLAWLVRRRRKSTAATDGG